MIIAHGVRKVITSSRLLPLLMKASMIYFASYERFCSCSCSSLEAVLSYLSLSFANSSWVLAISASMDDTDLTLAMALSLLPFAVYQRLIACKTAGDLSRIGLDGVFI